MLQNQKLIAKQCIYEYRYTVSEFFLFAHPSFCFHNYVLTPYFSIKGMSHYVNYYELYVLQVLL